MIRLQNNYIFLPKVKKADSLPPSKDADGTIHLEFGKKVRNYIKSMFGEPVRKDTENLALRIVYTYEIEIEGIKHEVVFTLYDITGYSYLDLCVSEKTEKQAVSVLEYLQDRFSNSGIEKQYIMIISYDSVSEYYCNKAYPKLNKLERNLRKLLFNIYTVNFGVDYYEKTIADDLQNKIKGVIQAKGNEEKKQTERLKKFFYSMEFSDIQVLLFAKKWTSVEEEKKAEFLRSNEKLRELSEEELRSAFDRFSPQSDWDRLFADKMESYDVEKMIEAVRLMRNDIAHCKFFYKEQYLSFTETVSDLNRAIVKAIKLTEEKDFEEKQVEAFRVAFEGIANSVAEFQKRMTESLIRSATAIEQSLTASMRQLGDAFLKMDFWGFDGGEDEEEDEYGDEAEGDEDKN